MIQFTNPRTEAEFDDWPSGRHRVNCRFVVEHDPKRGMRVARTTQHPTKGTWSKPKRTTYSRFFAICDGDDGRTYLLGLNDNCGNAVVVYQSDCQHVIAGGGYFYPDCEEYAGLKDLVLTPHS